MIFATVCLSYRLFSFGHCILGDLTQVLNVHHFEIYADMFLKLFLYCVAALNTYTKLYVCSVNGLSYGLYLKTHTDRLNINKFKIFIVGICSYCILRLS